MPTSCSAPYCGNTSSDKYCFKLIPKEGRNEWILESGCATWNPPASGRLCEVHFDIKDICKVDGKKFIRKNARPKLFCKCPSERGMPYPRASLKRKPFGELQNTVQVEPVIGIVLPKSKERSSDHIYSCTSAASSLSRGRPRLSHAPECIINRPPVSINDLEEESLDEAAACLVGPPAPLPSCNATDDAKDLKISSLEKRVQELTEERERLTEERERSRQILNKALLPEQQAAIITGTTRGRKWSDAAIKKGLELRMLCGTTGYKAVMKSLPLPSVRTLQERLAHIKFQPGVLEDVFAALDVIVPHLPKRRTICGLCVDEMAIQPRVDFDRNTNSYIGYVSLPGAQRELASKAFCAQLVGLEKSWKQWVGFHFVPGRMLDGPLRDFLIQLLQRSCQSGLTVIVMVSDMGLRGLLSLLGFNTTKDGMRFLIAHPVTPEKPFFMVPDPVHVFKNVKYMLIEHRYAIIPEDIAEAAGLPTNRADFLHVDWLDDFQSKDCQELKFAPKLNKKDIRPNHFMKMRVKTSTNVINHATAAAMHHLAENGTGPIEMMTTGWLIELLRKWFDLMTGRRMSHALSFHNMEAYQDALSTLRLVSKLFRYVKIGDGAWKPSQTHIIMATDSMLALQDHLLKDEGFEFFYCGKVTNDNVESGFSNLRRGRPKPSAMDVKYQLKSLTIVGQDTQVANASYRFSKVPSLIEFLLRIEKGKTTDDATATSLSLPSVSMCPELSPHVQEIFYRMCGCVLLKLRRAGSLNCDGCYQGLQDTDNEAASVSSFVTNTDYKEGAQIRVSVQVYSLLSAVERVMWHSRKQLMLCSQSTTEQLCGHFSNDLATYTITTCHDVKDMIIRRYVQMRLRLLSTTLTSDCQAERNVNSVSFGSRTMGGGILTENFQPSRRS